MLDHFHLLFCSVVLLLALCDYCAEFADIVETVSSNQRHLGIEPTLPIVSSLLVSIQTCMSLPLLVVYTIKMHLMDSVDGLIFVFVA
jgi:hypothetical protein